jgi:hypothetical protein
MATLPARSQSESLLLLQTHCLTTDGNIVLAEVSILEVRLFKRKNFHILKLIHMPR